MKNQTNNKVEKKIKQAYNKGYYAGRKRSVYSPEWVDHQMKLLSKAHDELIAKPKHIAEVLAVDPKDPKSYYVQRIIDIQVFTEGTRIIIEKETNE